MRHTVHGYCGVIRTKQDSISGSHGGHFYWALKSYSGVWWDAWTFRLLHKHVTNMSRDMIYRCWNYMTYLTPRKTIQTREALSTFVSLGYEKTLQIRPTIRYWKWQKHIIIINHQVYLWELDLWSSILTHIVLQRESRWCQMLDLIRQDKCSVVELYNLKATSFDWIQLHRLICPHTAILTSGMETRLGLAHLPHAAMNIFIVEVWLVRNPSMVACWIPMGSL